RPCRTGESARAPLRAAQRRLRTGRRMSALPRTPSFRLDGRRAIVTGASRGIGFASAVALAEAGAEVTLVARSHDELEARAAEIRAAFGTARALLLDVADIG